MDSAYVRNETSGVLLSPNPVAFVRLPIAGDLLYAPPGAWAVVRLIHGWNGPTPVAEVRVTQAAALSNTTGMQTSHF
jgi:hypothetical protein